MDLLRFITAGSVDDGKSTLILVVADVKPNAAVNIPPPPAPAATAAPAVIVKSEEVAPACSI